jgi:hypothetical protein
MTYAYIQGQEVQSLAYYKRLLDTEKNADARKALEAIIAKLEKAVSEGKFAGPRVEQAPHNFSMAS